jgi:hypothetical protein
MGLFNNLGSKLKGVWNSAKNNAIGSWNSITNNARRFGDIARNTANTISTKIQDGKNWVYDRSKFLKNISEATGLDGKINNVSDIFKNGGNLISSLSRGDLGGAKRDALNTLQNGGSLIGASSTAIDTGRRMINKAEEMGKRVQSGFNAGKYVLSSIDEGFNSSDGFTQKRQDNIASQSQNMLDRLKGLSTTTNRRPRLAVMKSQPVLK